VQAVGYNSKQELNNYCTEEPYDGTLHLVWLLADEPIFAVPIGQAEQPSVSQFTEGLKYRE